MSYLDKIRNFSIIAHIDHGIGKFMGLVKVNNNGKIQECFKLVYKNQDLLYCSRSSAIYEPRSKKRFTL